jgi:hypothetical protein
MTVTARACGSCTIGKSPLRMARLCKRRFACQNDAEPE